MKDKLQNDLKTALKGGDKLRLMTVRGILSEVTRLEKDVCREAEEAEIIQIIKRERARRDESLEFARRGKRFDLITQYEAEAKILEAYLPDAVGEEELNAAVAAQITEGANQIGPIMKALRDQFGARLDGKMASAAVKAALAPK
ncbi:MAG TPA: GatB/YqeY domain-containing protein [Candidatus Binataceae bacterium]